MPAPVISMLSPRRRELATELGAAAVCVLAAVALTWPMALHFTTRLGGDPGDPFQTLWSMRWMHDALTSFRNPFFTDRVFFPHGSTLVFETFDTPSAILAVPLWWVLPPFGVYNSAVLFGFALTAFGMYRLGRELTGDRLVSLAVGVLFTAVPYHLAHVQGHQHLVSMGWLPLYLVHLHRMIEGRGALRDALLGGLFLGLASLASWYHLLYAIVLTPLLFADAALRFRRGFFSKRFLGQAFALAAAYLVTAGPLLFAILWTRSHEEIVGSHDAVRFSGDLEAFFFPNLAQGWGHWFGGHAFRWTGNAAETALYAGYCVMALALLGAILASGARVYLLMAIVGAGLSLGPHLHVGGQVNTQTHLPYYWLEKLLPQLSFMGVPVRLGYVMYLGLLVSAGLAMAALRSRLRRSVPRTLVVLLPLVITLVEYTPRGFIESEAAAPGPMLEWGKDQAQYAVLDVSDDYRMMWHATLHRKPMIGGNITRVPKRLEDWYWGLPIIQGLRHPRSVETLAFTRVDPVIDFDWKDGAPSPLLHRDHFRIEWSGAVHVPLTGYWTFFLSSDDGATLFIDDRAVVTNPGNAPLQEGLVHLRLHEGDHALRLAYSEETGNAGVKLEWEGPEVARQIVPASALKTPDGAPGVKGEYRQLQETCGMSREEGRQALQALSVRYVVTGTWDSDPLSIGLGLPRIYEGEGVRIYEVPR